MATALATFAVDANATTIALHQDVVKNSIVKRMFADNGRRVLSGAIGSCNYAFLERPAVTLRDGRLYLRMHLVAQAGISVRGTCKGTGDAFATTISGQPFVNGEAIGIRDFRLEEGRDLYKSLLDPLMRTQIPALLGVNLRDELGKMFQNHAPDYRITVSQLQLQDVAAREGYLTIRFDVSLTAHENKPAQ